MSTSADMDSGSSFLRIEKLNEANFYTWKQKIQNILALKDLEDIIVDESPLESGSGDFTLWKKKDKKAQEIIGLSLSDQLLENVREVNSANNMWETIKNVFERHMLLNKLAARRKFYTATMDPSERVLQFSNRISHFATTLEGMNVDIDDSEMAMAL